MKKYLFFFLLSLTLAASCSKEKGSEGGDPDPKASSLQQNYMGLVTVTYTPKPTEENPTPSEVTHFDEDRLLFVTFSEDGRNAEIFFHKVKFSDNPLEPRSDIAVPSVKVDGSRSDCVLNVNEVDPLYAGNPFPRYHVSGLSGSIKDGKLTLSLQFGSYPTQFSGTLTPLTDYPE